MAVKLVVGWTYSTTDLMKGLCGDSWEMLACIDRLEELGKLRCVNSTGSRNNWKYVLGKESDMSKSLHRILRDSVVVNGVREVADIAPLTVSTSVSEMAAFDRIYVATLVLGLDVNVTYRSDKELDSMIDKACHYFTDTINSGTKREISKLIAKMEFDYRAKDYVKELKVIYEKL